MNEILRHLRLSVPLVAALTGAVHAGEIIVDRSGAGDTLDITSALAFAQDGDLILVRPGTYREDLLLDGLSVSIVAQQEGTAVVEGRLVIRSISSHQPVLLHGLRFEGVSDPALDAQLPTLEGLDLDGQLTVARCAFVGAPAADSTQAFDPVGGAGARLEDAFRFTARASIFLGGDGVDELSCTDGDGGDGLQLESSRAALWGCELEGGGGMSCTFDLGDGPGEGGAGLRAEGSRIFLSGCAMDGGAGGENGDFIPLPGGDGGNGAATDALTRLILVDTTSAGGAGGGSFAGPPGASGLPFAGAGLVRTLPGASEDHETPIFVRAQSLHPIEVRGTPGAVARLHLVPAAPFFFDVARAAGATPGVGPVPTQELVLGTIPASGVLNASVGIPALPPAATTLEFTFLVVTRSGAMASVLGAPLRVVAIQCSNLAPDCDGNGRGDLCDLLEGAEDCDGNGIPDTCQADCNGNGVADPCDIASGTSLDLNGDGIPDECQPQNATWHVDAAAPPGGDGSAAAPFEDLAAAFTVALSGDEVLVEDGTYRGPSNRDLDFGARTLTVRSVNGPGTCTIDLEQSGRAFYAYLPPASVRPTIQGLTIKNGHPSTAGPSNGDGGAIFARQCAITVIGCVFEGNQAQSGGAIRASAPALSPTGPRIIDCVFEANVAASSSAVALSLGAAEVDGCTFTNNTATGAGTVTLGGAVGAPAVVSRCTFLQNTALFGGALYALGGPGSAPEVNLVDQCVFAGNFAWDSGGAIAGSGLATTRVSNCTFVLNDALQVGGGISLDFGMSAVVLNSIFWLNSSGAGFDQITANSPGSTLEVHWTNLQGGAINLALSGGSTLLGTSNLIDADPLFLDPAGPDGNPLAFLDNDYRLAPGSPCIDAAAVSLLPPDRADLDGDGDRTEEVPFDLAGQTRRVDDPLVPDTGAGPAPAVDHGAFERQ